MINPSLSHGMVPDDVIVRSAIKAGLDDIRKNPFLLDFIFSWLLHDELTSKELGQAEFLRAKKWFLSHEIFCGMDFRIDDPKFPMVSVSLVSSTEDLSTLSDIDEAVEEDVPAEEVTTSPNILLGPFTPKLFDSTTGTVTLPDNLNTDNVFEGTLLYDKTNNVGYPITAVLDGSSFKIAENVSPNLTNTFIAPTSSFYSALIESCIFKQQYNISCFAQGDAVLCLYLHTIVQFILLRYKETLLESRGFDRSTISSGTMQKYNQTETEVVFFRVINLTGYVRQYWPKSFLPKMSGFRISGFNILANMNSLASENNNQAWGTRDSNYLL